MAKKCHFFTFFGVTRQNFLGFRWRNISTNEPVLERLLNFWIFGTYFKLIAHLVRATEPLKAKKSKIRVTRKPDLETQNWVYSFSSFIELYQTHIVTAQMLFDCWTVLLDSHYIVKALLEVKSFTKRLWLGSRIRWFWPTLLKYSVPLRGCSGRLIGSPRQRSRVQDPISTINIHEGGH